MKIEYSKRGRLFPEGERTWQLANCQGGIAEMGLFTAFTRLGCRGKEDLMELQTGHCIFGSFSTGLLPVSEASACSDFLSEGTAEETAQIPYPACYPESVNECYSPACSNRSGFWNCKGFRDLEFRIFSVRRIERWH